MLREDVKAGMTFRDMDRRMNGRLIKIDALKKITVDCGRFEAGETYARYKGGNGRVQWVNISRLVDLKEYELVDPGQPDADAARAAKKAHDCHFCFDTKLGQGDHLGGETGPCPHCAVPASEALAD
jgi:hypothetical protein